MMQGVHEKLSPGLPWQMHNSKDSLHQQIRLRSKEEISEVLHLEHCLYGAETWTLRKLDQMYMENFQMWCWRRMDTINWTDRVILHTIR
jgi:hypothetical protein